MADKRLTPSTYIDRGPPREKPIELDPNDPETLEQAAGDSSAQDMDANVGGASATAGLDSGGAVGVRRGLSVGRAGAQYDRSERGETDDMPEARRTLEEVIDVPAWANPLPEYD